MEPTRTQSLAAYIIEQNAQGYKVCEVYCSGPDAYTSTALLPDDDCHGYQVRSEPDSHFAAYTHTTATILICYFNQDHQDELLLSLNPEFEVGCLFDGAVGYPTNSQRVIDLAKQHGWVPSEPNSELNEDENREWDESEATTYLEQFAPENHWVGWNDGDFGVWLADEDEY